MHRLSGSSTIEEDRPGVCHQVQYQGAKVLNQENLQVMHEQ